MKKLLLIFSVIALAACGKDEPELTVMGDGFYVWNFKVVNQTAANVVVTDQRADFTQPDLTKRTSIAPARGEVIADIGTIGSPDAKVVMEDILASYRDPAQAVHSIMTIDGVEVPAKIWSRANWTFEAGLYESTYTLVLTDELLDEL